MTRLGTAPEPIEGIVTSPVSGSLDTLVDSGASLPYPNADNDNDIGLVGLYVDVNDGFGFLQTPRLITDNTATSLTLATPFDDTIDLPGADPNDPSEYRISTYPEDQTDGKVYRPTVIVSVDPELGGNDTIRSGDASDIVIGGAGADDIDVTIADDDVIDDELVLGDSGQVMAAVGNTGDNGSGGDYLVTLGRVMTTAAALGGNDRIITGEGNDIVLGGAGGDDIRSGSGNDLVHGDNALISFVDDKAGDVATLDLIQTLDNAIGGADVIRGEGGEDILIGGASGDRIDGGANQDLIFGDAVTLSDRVNDISSGRFQVLLGQLLYSRAEVPAWLQGTATAPSGNDAGEVLVDGIARDFRNSDGSAPVWAEYQVENLYHSADIEELGAETGGFGDDYIAGGADDDMIFGQLGDDVIQGDGSIESADDDDNRVGAERVLSGQTQVSPSLSPVDAYTLSITASFDAETDGDDYIEGNGGSDVIFGNLGQDDIIGGSSSLFTLATPELRPDADDILFGGSGTEIEHNELLGDTLDENDPDTIIPSGDEHARDADVIAGDNANIYRIVGTGSVTAADGTSIPGVPDAGGFLNFAYDAARGGTEWIRVRAVELLDYTPGGPDFAGAVLEDGSIDHLAFADIGGADEIHGESGDDFIYGMAGADVLFGDSESDDLIGGWGADWISGGQGMDGVIGDDGRIYTGRYQTFAGSGNKSEADPTNINDYAELLNGILEVDELDKEIRTPGGIQQAIINPSENAAGLLGEIFKTVDLTPFNLDPDPFMQDQDYAPSYANDIIFGGLGNDFLHGAAGDDAMSGAEALPEYFDTPFNPGDVLRFDPDRIEFADYDEEFPRQRLENFLLNFDPAGDPNTAETANNNFDEDVLFGDLGNDWLVGGPDNDQLFGGFGADLMDADDDKSTNDGDNLAPDPVNIDIQDIAYGGAGRDVLMANTGGDRLMDWVGEFNSFIAPFAPFGGFTVSRAPTPHAFTFLYELSASLGADQSRAVDSGNTTDAERNGEPDGELGLVTQKDGEWQDQSGAPVDPQPGNIPGGPRLTLRGVDFNSGTTEAFAVDQGIFEAKQGRLEVSSTSLGETASAVFHVGEYLPHYYEISATISTGKPIAGLKANSYLIFDYVSPTDFKYAGINISTDKIEMGYVDAAGWHELVQLPAQLKAVTDYDVLLAINGLTATLVVDSKDVLTFTYDARVDSDGFTYGLNYGLVGLGGIGSIARVDNMLVQKLSPEITFEATENFDLGAPGFTPWLGNWNALSGTYVGSSALPNVEAMSLFDLDVAPNSFLELEVTVSPDTLGGVVFDHYEDSTYKFAGVLADTNQVVIGHVGQAGTVVYDAVADITFALPSSSEYSLRVSLQGSVVSVALLGGNAVNPTWYDILGHAFNAVTVDGQAGVLSIGGTSTIDTFVIRTDDPAYFDPNAVAEPAPVPEINPVATYSNSQSAGIPDRGMLISTIEVTDTFALQDINVELNISHTRLSDLRVVLVSASGTRIELFNGIGGSNDNFTATLLDDDATDSILAGAAPYTGSFRPTGDLALLEGEQVNGTWTLEVYDQARRETGTLDSWSLIVTRGDSLLASGTPAETGSGQDDLTEAQLAGIVDEAMRRWSDSGLLDADQLAVLNTLKFEVADLSDTSLGLTTADTIYIDSDAAGFGWFVDQTPADDAEFADPDGDGLYSAVVGGSAEGRMDLLTVVLHEIGHVLGMDHADDDMPLMSETLAAGDRAIITVSAETATADSGNATAETDSSLKRSWIQTANELYYREFKKLIVRS